MADVRVVLTTGGCLDEEYARQTWSWYRSGIALGLVASLAVPLIAYLVSLAFVPDASLGALFSWWLLSHSSELQTAGFLQILCGMLGLVPLLVLHHGSVLGIRGAGMLAGFAALPLAAFVLQALAFFAAQFFRDMLTAAASF